MTYDTLYKEVIGLPDDKLNLLIDFARFLKQDVNNSENAFSKSTITDNSFSNKERAIGLLADDFIFIAPDFDECIDGLEDYV